MANGYEEIRIGPFTGGLNTLSDQSAIDDTELHEVVNFELDKDGSLVSRPPLLRVGSQVTQGVKILGYYTDASTATYYLIVSLRNGGTYYYASGVYTLITNTFEASSVVMFRDKLYLLAPLSSSNPGGTWTPSGGFVADATMPKGAVILALKERLWVAQGKAAPTNGSRIYVTGFSSGAPVWAGDFINIQNGDGQNVVDMTTYNGELLIFKQNSTYRFSYDADPATGAVLPVAMNIGTNYPGCYAQYANRLFVLFGNAVYELTNYSFYRLNDLVPLRADNPSASLYEVSGISVWADRLLVNYYDKLYVYNLTVRTWSTWESTKVKSFGRFFTVPFDVSEAASAFVYSTQPNGTDEARYLYQITDKIQPGSTSLDTQSEQILCHFVTKNYDYQSSTRWKRLRYWAADVLSRTDVNVIAQPVIYSVLQTWDDLAGKTWDELGTWDRPLDISYDVSDNVSTQGLSGGRKLVKFMKSLRFRQIAFRVSATTWGTSDTAPVRVYKLATYVREKQGVSRKIN